MQKSEPACVLLIFKFLPFCDVKILSSRSKANVNKNEGKLHMEM